MDIYERESDVGGNFSTKFEYNDCEYDLYPVKINFSEIYMKYFHDASGKILHYFGVNKLLMIFKFEIMEKAART
jgi:hypothetical protein